MAEEERKACIALADEIEDFTRRLKYRLARPPRLSEAELAGVEVLLSSMMEDLSRICGCPAFSSLAKEVREITEKYSRGRHGEAFIKAYKLAGAVMGERYKCDLY